MKHKSEPLQNLALGEGTDGLDIIEHDLSTCIGISTLLSALNCCVFR